MGVNIGKEGEVEQCEYMCIQHRSMHMKSCPKWMFKMPLLKLKEGKSLKYRKEKKEIVINNN